uniref:Uncharacterized protein n=1 Tax=Plectus sambesii TaxID=2011161 RepID=A0A914V8A3_9BILA
MVTTHANEAECDCLPATGAHPTQTAPPPPVTPSDADPGGRNRSSTNAVLRSASLRRALPPFMPFPLVPSVRPPPSAPNVPLEITYGATHFPPSCPLRRVETNTFVNL